MFKKKTAKETMKRLSAMLLSACLLAGVCTTPIYAAEELGTPAGGMQTPETAEPTAVESEKYPGGV